MDGAIKRKLRAPGIGEFRTVAPGPECTEVVSVETRRLKRPGHRERVRQFGRAIGLPDPMSPRLRLGSRPSRLRTARG